MISEAPLRHRPIMDQNLLEDYSKASKESHIRLNGKASKAVAVMTSTRNTAVQ